MHEIILIGGCIEWLMYDSGYYFYSKHASIDKYFNRIRIGTEGCWESSHCAILFCVISRAAARESGVNVLGVHKKCLHRYLIFSRRFSVLLFVLISKCLPLKAIHMFFFPNISLDVQLLPRVLLSHIPLYRRDYTYCGPHRSSPIINQVFFFVNFCEVKKKILCFVLYTPFFPCSSKRFSCFFKG